MKKQFIPFFFLLLIAYTTNAQKKKALKYKDIYELVLNGPEIKAYQELKTYQEQFPEENANVYYQLGKICQKWMRKYDPLKEIDDVEYFIQHTKIFFGLCQSKLTNHQLSSNREYFSGIERISGEKRLTVEDVVADIKLRLEDAKLFEQKHKQLQQYYNHSLEQYDHCIDLFMDINRKNSNLKHLYLTTDQTFRDTLNTLANTYDSALTNFKAYQALVQDYPMGDYNPQLKIRDIVTYRLHGLTSSNFLDNEVTLWDFGKWVKNYLSTLDGEVATLRSEVKESGDALEERIAFFSKQKAYQDDWTSYSIPNKTAFHIHKWDYHSNLLDLFRYQEAKANYLKKSRMQLNDPKSSVKFQQKALYYQDLWKEQLKLDSVHRSIHSVFTQVGFDRHQAYLSKRFGSLANIHAYTQEEKSQNRRVFNRAIDNLKTFTLSTLKAVQDKKQTLIWKEKTIHSHRYQEAVEQILFNSQPDSATDNRYYTFHSVSNETEEYITGFYKSPTRFAKAFVAKVILSESTKEVAWVKEIPQKGHHPTIGMQVSIQPNGCLIALTSVDSTLQNFIIDLDSLGKITQVDTIHSTQYPRFMDYDPINKELVVSCKGSQVQEQWSISEKMDISLINQELKTVWAQSVQLQGTLVNLIRSNNTFHFFGNFHQLEAQEGQVQKPQAASGIYSLKIPHNGQMIQSFVYPTKTDASLLQVVKNNDKYMSLLGLRQVGKSKAELLNTPQKFYYSIINYDGKIELEHQN